VLEFATLDEESLAAESSIDGNTPPVPTFADNKLLWSGDLAVGEVITLSYTVKVADDAFAKTLTNSVISSATFLGNDVESTCTDGSEEGCTITLATDDAVNDLGVQKTADPISGATVNQGDEITYKIALENRGEQALTTTADDNLVEVLKYADLVDGSLAAESSVANNSPAKPTFENGKLSWSGEIAPGEIVTLTYKVKIKADAYDVKFQNVVVTTAVDPESDEVETTCATGEEANCWTEHQTAVKPPLPPNTSESNWLSFAKNLAGFAMIFASVLAGGIFVARRRFAKR
jgi:hypothetical protein